MSIARAFSTALISLTILSLGTAGAAQPGKGPPDKAAKQEKKAHKHHHANGHNLLGAKLKQNGKHEVGKIANRAVTAEVKNGKVTNMAAGDLAVKRVKTKQKMASADELLRTADSGMIHLAQYDDYYYGYCFDDGYEYSCYWYPAEDVDYADYSWDEYDPYY